MLSKEKLLLALALAVPLAAPSVALAASDDEELEDDAGAKKKKKADDKEDAARIREIVRGVYAKVNIGGAIYPADPAISAGTLVGISIGQDFVDREKQSMAWEIGFLQGLHNGVDWSLQAGQCRQYGGGPYGCTEGDLRTYALQASYEFSLYPTRRLGVGFRVGGGALYSPVLIFPAAYESDVLPALGTDPAMHDAFHPYGMGGLTAEYYTKLNHFSIGIDAEAFYAFGWDLGINVSAGVKYTF